MFINKIIILDNGINSHLITSIINYISGVVIPCDLCKYDKKPTIEIYNANEFKDKKKFYKYYNAIGSPECPVLIFKTNYIDRVFYYQNNEFTTDAISDFMSKIEYLSSNMSIYTNEDNEKIVINSQGEHFALNNLNKEEYAMIYDYLHNEEIKKEFYKET